MNGNATGISRSPSAELSTECVVDMIPGSNQDVVIALHRKMVCFAFFSYSVFKTKKIMAILTEF